MKQSRWQRQFRSGHLDGGFTLIELMITIAVVALLASVALPSYAAYMQRSRVPPALSALSMFQMRMEQYFQDNRVYDNGSGACGATAPAIDGNNFTLSCSLTLSGTTVVGYTATATGSGSMLGYQYTINNFGTRTTVHPLGNPSSNCWSIRGKTCDT